MEEFKYDKTFYPFESKWLEIQGNRIHYIDEGKGDVLLFCHPPISTSWMYRNLIKTLSKSFRCIALDFPGFGMSTASRGYVHSIEMQAIIVQAFIDHLKLAKITPVVQEIGGHAALTALAQSPERLKGIILTDTIIFPVSEYPQIGKMLGIVNGRLVNFLNTQFNFLIRMTSRFGIRKRKLGRSERREYRRIFATPEKRRLITHMLHQLKIEEGLIKQIKVAFETTFSGMPVLLIYGDKDPIYGMGIPQRIQQMVQQSELHLIRGEAHFPHEGAPDEMSSIIAEWMQTKIISQP
jgi:haloalkane dehalogenase